MIRLVVLDGSVRPGGNTCLRARCGLCAARRVRRGRPDRPLQPLGDRVTKLRIDCGAADGLPDWHRARTGARGPPSMQRFLEPATSYEATDVFLGKPSSVLVTMDSTGGGEVAARLAATFACLGCFTPVRVDGAVADRRGAGASRPDTVRDVWSYADIAVLVGNLVVAARAPRLPYRPWNDRTLRARRPPLAPDGAPRKLAAPEF